MGDSSCEKIPDKSRVRILIPRNEIMERARVIVAELRMITTQSPKRLQPIFFTIVEGGRPWAADLEHEWRVQTRYAPTTALIKASSYVGEKSTGKVKVEIDYVYDRLLKAMDPINQDIVLVEDVFDTGKTLQTVLDEIRTRTTARVIFVPLLNKVDTGTLEFNVKPYRVCHRHMPLSMRDFMIAGFDIDKTIFTLGYGMDLDGRYRDLNYVGQRIS